MTEPTIIDQPALVQTATRVVPLLFLDIDGTVRHGKDQLGRFVNGPDDVVLFPEAVPLMRQWKANGGRIAGVSNQGGIALGHVTHKQVWAAMDRTNVLTEGLIDTIMICPHHPDAGVPEISVCWCRKPRAGMLIEAAVRLGDTYREVYPAHMALMVGDRPEDEAAAAAAAVPFLSAAEWRAGA